MATQCVFSATHTTRGDARFRFPTATRTEWPRFSKQRLSISTRRQICTGSDRRRKQKPLVQPLRCSNVDKETDQPVYQELADSVAKGLGGTNVYLVGMMGSGKTTVGSVLAKNLNYMFMDSDSLIEKAVKCSIEEIFELNGEEEFRKLETSVLQDLHQYKKLIVGTGGGIVIRQVNWSYLYQGVVVFLNGPPEKLAYRVAKDGLSGRPLLAENTDKSSTDAVNIAKEKLQRIYTEREKLYKNADIEITLEDETAESGLASVDEVVSRILKALNQRMEDAKSARNEKQNFNITGTADLPDGRSTINSPGDEKRT